MALQGWILAHEAELRLGCFLGIFLLMAMWEWRLPCRELRYSRWLRWSNNLGLVFLNSLILRVIFPVAAVGVAAYTEQQQWGIFHFLNLPFWLEVLLAVVVLDCLIYWQHRLFHVIPFFWRLHRVHHADPDYDVTTGARFHPIEIVLSMLIKCLAVGLLGVSALSVILFEILLNGSAMFNHANIRLPSAIDSAVRKLVVTPDMHRVHHSSIRQETDSNFGFALSVWDRLFGSYKAQPDLGHVGMDIGLKELRDPVQICRLDGLLKIPFSKEDSKRL